MSFTSNNAHRRFCFALGVAACSLIGPLHGQSSQNAITEPGESIDFPRIASLLQTLDDQAQACLQELNLDANDAAAICQQFVASIDGATVEEYLQLCRQARSRRDRIVTASREQPLADDLRDSTLQLLLDTEFYCGDSALQQRTDYVFPAFAALNPTADASNSGSQRNYQRRTEQSTSTGLIPIQPRLQDETNRLWQDLQLELLRQQINRPGH